MRAVFQPSTTTHRSRWHHLAQRLALALARACYLAVEAATVSVVAGCQAEAPNPPSQDAAPSETVSTKCVADLPCTEASGHFVANCACDGGPAPASGDMIFVCCNRGRTAVTLCIDGYSFGTVCQWTVADSGVDASDGADSDSPASCSGPGTFDVATEEMAKTICAMSSPCKVCVQSTDDAGAPTKWSALQIADDCPCPMPSK
jgi:hypothetical protein